MPPTRHAHCSYCGSAYTAEAWPRRCEACENITYRNPLPVAVLLQPVDDGLLIVRRGIEPQRGWWSLPGGYMDVGETWQGAAARELREECGVIIDPVSVRDFYARSVTADVLIVFGIGPHLRSADLPPFEINEESLERGIAAEPMPLAFDWHSRAMADWFAQKERR